MVRLGLISCLGATLALPGCIVTYGLGEGNDLRAVNLRREGLCTTFDVLRSTPGEARAPLTITVNLPGTHNVLNSLAAIGVAQELGIADEAVQRALARFQGVGRRLVEAAENWARIRGFREIGSDTQLSNAASQEAHAKLGFEEAERIVAYRKPL